ncbi:hypothetical protein PCI56_01190 [Plesiomonas shigelloides subsp. oncorhynchi]|nr:hypothetical protein [Plesiomonas shigelloides]
MVTIESIYAQMSPSELEWTKNHRLEWMDDNQWLLYLFLNRLFRGFHHVPAQPKPAGRGIEINFRPYCLSTFDYDHLTKLVIMSHNWCVRSQIAASGPGLVKLQLFKRSAREGDVSDRHPDMQQALEKYKDY